MGWRVRECRDSIIQNDTFRARRAIRLVKPTGISVNRFEDMSNECRVFANGARLEDANDVSELSAILRCRRKRHFEAGRMPTQVRFDDIPLLKGSIE